MPGMEGAIEALRLGVSRYLVKPVAEAALLAAVERAAELYAILQLRGKIVRTVRPPARAQGPARRAMFAQGLGSLVMAYQPIVAVGKRQVVAHEALLRSPHLRTDELLEMADELGEMHALGRAVRAHVAETLTAAPEARVFVNVHPDELGDDEIYSPSAPLTRHASRVALEITERASLHEVPELLRRIGHLRRLGYAIAVDDLGAGYSGLESIVLLEPDIIKLDAVLVRQIQAKPIQMRLVEALVPLAAKSKMLLIAEAVETHEESDALSAIGVDLQQGWRFARPGPPWPSVAW
jgi:EAL domain-containing protein (putative c-di-GMP-specific phosphodiesterase class I)